ncbi:SPOR domain-containing protein [Shewanella sp. NIFS-20-20]|uniref:SPOR domain-containing protein n=1 Tax=Shewanella sp. NIFS-20-20 TaxID=2853806 RepID=UPI001C481B9C|nr:SPOR domain-containing protein [Shewanella sp. NIFS-20-20]MBV7316829.1 SPOR domain-containing protein [Shewanella sp. NIFS-20-20]
MTNRDYANRKPRSTSKNRHAKASRPAKRSPAGTNGKRPSFLLIFFAVILIGLFGYFLNFLKSSGDSAATPATEAPVKAVKPAPKPDPNALPPKPKEEWSYQKELENKQVVVDVPEESKPSRPYQMQCGSFRSESQANEMKAVIAFQGLEAQVRKTEGSKGVWYKVVLGPYERKRMAERQRHKLQSGGLNGCQIWLWEGN